MAFLWESVAYWWNQKKSNSPPPLPPPPPATPGIIAKENNPRWISPEWNCNMLLPSQLLLEADKKWISDACQVSCYVLEIDPKHRLQHFKPAFQGNWGFVSMWNWGAGRIPSADLSTPNIHCPCKAIKRAAWLHKCNTNLATDLRYANVVMSLFCMESV